jgi:hypothetical protein
VKLWKAGDGAIREYLLAHPREALANATAAEPDSPPDPRLTPKGQRLQRYLRILQAVAPKTVQMLRPNPVAEEDLAILASDLESTRSSLCRLLEVLGSARPRTN